MKTHAYELGVTSSRNQDPLVTRRAVDFASGGEDTSKIDIHLHLPAGAQKKDGPSAGIAMVSPLTTSHSLELFLNIIVSTFRHVPLYHC